MLSEVCLVGHKGIDPLDQVVVALGYLLDMPTTIIPRNVLDVEDLQKFESNKVIVRMLILLGQSIGEEWLDLADLLFVYQLYGRLVTHRTRSDLLTSGRVVCFVRCLVIETVGLLRASLFIRTE